MRRPRRTWRCTITVLAGLVVVLSAGGCDPPPVREVELRPPPAVEADATRPPVQVGITRVPVEASFPGTACHPQSDRPSWLFRDSVQWTPDGSTVLFTDGSKIFAVAADGSRLWNVVVPAPPEGKREWPMAPFTISPDGEQVVYATCDYHRFYELARVGVDGTQPQRLTRNTGRFDNHPAWSPDGRRLAFLAYDFDLQVGGSRPSSIRPRLYTMGSDGSDVTEVHIEAAGELLHLPPQWSPDSERLAFAQREVSGGVGLYTVAVDGGDPPQRLSATVSSASWSPDGTRLAFAKPDGDDVALYTIAADGTDAQRVTTITGWQPRYGEPDPTRVWIESLAWSPDGKHILHTCASAICVVSLDGAPVSEAPLRGSLAAWSPDGSRIAVADAQHGTLVKTMAPDGSDARVLVLAALGGPIAAESGYDDLAASQAACTAGVVVEAPVENPGLVRDCETLLELRDALFGSMLGNWGAGTPITQWVGLTVSGAPLRVTKLNLSGLKSAGPLPATFGDLTQLRMLDLSHNKFSGTIPPALGELTQLQVLILSHNQFSGPLPPEVGNLSQLQVLVVRGGGLTGGIPAELGSLANLHILNLADNELTGGIPAELGQLKNLLVLSLDGNKLAGAIPAEMGQLTNLTGDAAAILHQFANSLAGDIDVMRIAWGQLFDFTGLSLHSNQLTGPIPPELGQLTQLTELDLHSNQLTGHIPAELGQLTALWRLSLADNQLTGSIPAELGRLIDATDLALGGNPLTGCIPPALQTVLRNDLASLGLPDCRPA